MDPEKDPGQKCGKGGRDCFFPLSSSGAVCSLERNAPWCGGGSYSRWLLPPKTQGYCNRALKEELAFVQDLKICKQTDVPSVRCDDLFGKLFA